MLRCHRHRRSHRLQSSVRKSFLLFVSLLLVVSPVSMLWQSPWCAVMLRRRLRRMLVVVIFDYTHVWEWNVNIWVSICNKFFVCSFLLLPHTHPHPHTPIIHVPPSRISEAAPQYTLVNAERWRLHERQILESEMFVHEIGIVYGWCHENALSKQQALQTTVN